MENCCPDSLPQPNFLWHNRPSSEDKRLLVYRRKPITEMTFEDLLNNSFVGTDIIKIIAVRGLFPRTDSYHDLIHGALQQ